MVEYVLETEKEWKQCVTCKIPHKYDVKGTVLYVYCFAFCFCPNKPRKYCKQCEDCEHFVNCQREYLKEKYGKK